MLNKIFIALVVVFLSQVAALQPAFKWMTNYALRASTSLAAMPMELTGQLDPSRKWDVTLEFNGETKVVSIAEGTSILEASEKIWDGKFAYVILLLIRDGMEPRKAKQFPVTF
jgi:hypothetical protein